MSESYRVAIADDEPRVSEFLKESLVRAGHEVVVEADSGEELVSFCESTSPELIITDIKMKQMDGISAVQAILETQDIPVIILSAYHTSELIDRANDCKALAYLIKPIRQEDLLATIPLVMQRFGEISSLRSEVSDLRQAMEDRKNIERAKGIVMRRMGLDEASAFHHLQRMARSNRMTLAQVAKNIIFAEQALSTPDT